MKKLLLFTFLMGSMVSLAQTVLSIPNPGFEDGVGTASWSITGGAVTGDAFQNDWQVVASGTYSGNVTIQGTDVNTGSGALKIVPTSPAGSTNAKVRSSVVTYNPASPIASAVIDIKFNATSGTSGSARPKVNILYDIDGGTFSGKSLSGRINPVGTFALHDSASGTILNSVTITDPINSSITIQFEIEFGQATADIDLDDVEVTLTEGATLSTKDFTATALNLYPNPVKDVLNITDQDVKTASVYNLVGQKVLEATVTNTLNVESLNKGMYLVQLKKQNESGVISRKFIKN